jgi:hypothetical protein
MHNRLYVGDEVLQKLKNLDRKRLSNKFQGDDLDRAVEFSDLNSGPKNFLIGELYLTGVECMLVPMAAQKDLESIGFKLLLKEQEKEVLKYRRRASGVNFYMWCRSQIGRPDAIGDLITEMCEDDNFPRSEIEYCRIHEYFGNFNEAIKSVFKMAWLEYIAQYNNRTTKRLCCGFCGELTEITNLAICMDQNDDGIVLGHRYCCETYGVDIEEINPDSDSCEDTIHDYIHGHNVSQFEKDRLIGLLTSTGILTCLQRGSIYFVQSVSDKCIKIGFTTRSVQKRIAEMQTGHAGKLIELCVLHGTRDLEGQLHNQFKNYRVNGEWFMPNPELLNYISSINSK